MDCALKTVREDGALGLWAGAAPTVLRNGTNQMCLFWAKNHMDGILWGGCNHTFPVNAVRAASLPSLLEQCWNIQRPQWASPQDCGILVLNEHCAR